MSFPEMNRRSALKAIAGGLAFPFVARAGVAPPSETLNHASFGGSGMALADIRSLTASPHVRLVAVADVDLDRTAEVKRLFPEVRVYQDYRELLDSEADLDSVNVSTPDHMHAPITREAIRRGLHVYTQKPLTQTLYEARQLTKAASDRGIVSQMGIQIHSHPVHKAVVATVHDGAIGKVREVHSWSGKQWGDRAPRPDRTDPVPEGLDWDGWLGVAEERPFISGWYHPGNWRKRLDFGTGTFGDMGCHILDPVFSALELTAPTEVRSEGGAPNEHSWGLDSVVRYTFPASPRTVDGFTLTWYDGDRRPPEEVAALIGDRRLSDQGSIYIGEEGVLYSPYIDAPVLLPAEKFMDYARPGPEGDDHYLQFVEACRGNGETSTPFSYAGPLTEMVLLGCLATRFPETSLAWDAEALKVTNLDEANRFVRREPREGYRVEGL
ncbi:Gfo/Idh/MocA family protein [Tautonia plasticadhaerens]|uniref:1,5-anhydro-D-fructose reductase n=1 Tax=Tautonia plasticadhaerens TaxID=2527974 RepID=A0A518GVR9_9BACT|nr:Gfo/Idh/MocA family oxidoreductase [Tautonia plasticadhaerens]QDV32658.1 1,5-anhydro-D-fructose reductase [Tautonia plasticadhaerens]